MSKQSRVGDQGIGTCPNHNGSVDYVTVFCSGAATVGTNSKQDTFVGTIGVSSCGHPTVALTGSSLKLIEGKQAHRIGDTGANYGNYVVTTGSSNVEVGNG